MKDTLKTKDQLIAELASLRKSEEQYRSLIMNIPGVVWTADENFHIVFLSPNIKDITGYTAEEEYQQTKDFLGWYERAHLDDLVAAKAAFWRFMKEGTPFDTEYRIRNKDGRWLWIHDRSLGTYQKDGTLYADGIISDITERKEAEQKLKESEEQYRSLIINIPGVVWTSDEHFRVVFLSPNIKNITGYTVEEERYRMGDFLDWYERVHPDDAKAAETAYRKLMEEGKPYDIEYRFRSKNGRWVWIHERSLGTYEKGGKRYADGLTTNITNRKRAEKKLNSFQKRLRSLASETSLAEEHERRRLARGLHDQVGQTLAMIRMKLSALQRLPSPIAENEQLIEIEQFVDDVIKETRSLTFELSPPHLYELSLEAAVGWLAGQFKKNYGITCSFEDDGQPKPLADDTRGILFAAIRELLTNIVKHAQARNVRISIRREQHSIHIEVQDNGIGFSVTQLERRGGGFGLFSIRERLRYLGGNVRIKSRTGRGTLITLDAPMQSG